MAVSYASSVLRKQAIVLLLVAAIPISSLPLANVHAHDDAYAGHGHGHSHFVDHHAAPHDAESTADGSESGLTDKLHVHDLPAVVLIAVESPIAPDAPFLDSFVAARLHARPPDKFSAPLLRPPIA